jgi:hypothetical protein
MKAIKIILVVAVLTAIIYFICKWYNGIICPPPTTKPTNESIDSIQSRIKNLDSKPAHMFCQDYYNKVQWEIDYAYKNGLLGKHYQNINNVYTLVPDSVMNDSWYGQLSRDLYSRYCQKFIEQSNYVFNGNIYNKSDIAFIRNEEQALRNSPYYDPTAKVVIDFKNIRDVILKYDNIESFISRCNNLRFDDFSIEYTIPVSDISQKISISKMYLADNSQIKNCKYLMDGLKDIPAVLFNKHVDYLENKINEFDSSFADGVKFPTQIYWTRKVYNVLDAELDKLDNDVYNLPFDQFMKSKNVITNKLNTLDKNAYNHYKKKS